MNCQECSLDRTKMLNSVGPADADIMIVGEAPALNEIKLNKHFVGKTGQLINSVLEYHNINRDECYVTNVCLCRPPRNRTPNKQEIDCCRPRLEAEIKSVKPKVIVTLGNIPTQTILDTQKGITELQGRYYWSDKFNCWVVPTYNPAAIFHHEEWFFDLVEDIGKIKMLLDGPDDLSLDTIYYVYDDPQEAIKALHVLEKKYELFACDIETSGFNWKSDRITELGISYEIGKALIFPEKILLNHEFSIELKKFFANTTKRFIWHNGKFDCKFLAYQYGFEMRQDEDTMLQHYSIREHKGTHDLTQLSMKFLNAPNYEAEFKKTIPKGGSYADAPADKRREYLAYDADYTLRLHNIFNKIQDEHETFAYKNVMIPASNMLMDVEMHGFMVDIEYLNQMDKKYKKRIKELEQELQQIAKEVGWDAAEYKKATGRNSPADDAEYNPNSHYQTYYIVFKLLKIPKHKGRTSADEEARKYWLKILQRPKQQETESDEDYEKRLEPWLKKRYSNRFVHLYDKFKKDKKLHSTYIVGLKESVWENGRVHSTYLIHGTETGRLSSREPNLQNQPRNKEFKDIFIAPKGYKLMEADYSQAELRVLAVLSDDDFLKQVYMDGKDLHDEVSKEMFGPNFTDEQRVRAKAINFGVAYGRTAWSIAEEYSIPKEEAEELINKWFDQKPKAAKFIENARNAPRRGKTLVTPFGRKRRFGLITEKNEWLIENEAVNFPIQSTASDLTLMSAVRLHKILKKTGWAHIVNLVHDSIVLEVPEENVDRVARLVKKIMEETPQIYLDTEVPFVVDVEVGDRWGSLEKYDFNKEANKYGTGQN